MGDKPLSIVAFEFHDKRVQSNPDDMRINNPRVVAVQFVPDIVAPGFRCSSYVLSLFLTSVMPLKCRHLLFDTKLAIRRLDSRQGAKHAKFRREDKLS